VQKRQNINYYLAGAVALATFLVYLPALQNGFVEWDDGSYVLYNMHIRSLDPVFFKWAFFNFYASNWHPMTWISHALDYAIWGLNPLGHHLTNIILHAVNTFLVVVLAMRLLEAFRERAALNGSLSFLNDRAILIAGGTTGLLFGLHPLHVESVAWVAERKDLFCALFFLLSIMSYLNYAGSWETAEKGHGSGVTGHWLEGRDTDGLVQASFFSNKYYIATLGFFVLALLSKPMAVTLPVVLLILDWHPYNRLSSWKAIRPVVVEKLPFMVLTCASSIVTVLAQKAGGSFSALEIIPISIRMLVGAKALISYLGKIVAPLYLAPFYPYPRDVSFTSWQYLLAPILVIAMTAGFIAIAKKRPYWTAAWAYYVATLLPVLGIVQVGAQSMADRYTYLPSLGPFLIAGGVVGWISSNGKTEKKRRDIGRMMFTIIVGIVFAGMTYGTVLQIGMWKNGITLWSRVIELEGESAPMAYYYRGVVFEKRGQLDKALEDYNRAITIYPSYVQAYSDRGAVFEKMGLVQRALEDYNRAIDLDPSYYAAYNNKGTLYGKAESFGDAIESFNKAIAVNPGLADAYFNRGVTFVFMGQYSGALQDFNRAVVLNPNDATVYTERGNLYKKTGNTELAVADFRKACDLGYGSGCAALRESAQ